MDRGYPPRYRCRRRCQHHCCCYHCYCCPHCWRCYSPPTGPYPSSLGSRAPLEARTALLAVAAQLAATRQEMPLGRARRSAGCRARRPELQSPSRRRHVVAARFAASRPRGALGTDVARRPAVSASISQNLKFQAFRTVSTCFDMRSSQDLQRHTGIAGAEQGVVDPLFLSRGTFKRDDRYEYPKSIPCHRLPGPHGQPPKYTSLEVMASSKPSASQCNCHVSDGAGPRWRRVRQLCLRWHTVRRSTPAHRHPRAPGVADAIRSVLGVVLIHALRRRRCG